MRVGFISLDFYVARRGWAGLGTGLVVHKCQHRFSMSQIGSSQPSKVVSFIDLVSNAVNSLLASATPREGISVSRRSTLAVACPPNLSTSSLCWHTIYAAQTTSPDLGRSDFALRQVREFCDSHSGSISFYGQSNFETPRTRHP